MCRYLGLNEIAQVTFVPVTSVYLSAFTYLVISAQFEVSVMFNHSSSSLL